MKKSVLIAALLCALASVAHAAEKPAFFWSPRTDDLDRCTAEAKTAEDKYQCAKSYSEKTEGELSSAYKAVLAAQVKKSVPSLKKAQKAWVDYRNAHCAFTLLMTSKDYMPTQKALCLGEQNDRRSSELYALIAE